MLQTEKRRVSSDGIEGETFQGNDHWENKGKNLGGNLRNQRRLLSWGLKAGTKELIDLGGRNLKTVDGYTTELEGGGLKNSARE